MKTTIITVDEAIARGNYNWEKRKNDCEFKGYFPGYTTGFCLEYLKDGQIVLQGTPEEVLTAENIYDVYGVHSSVVKHPITGKMSITFLPAEIS